MQMPRRGIRERKLEFIEQLIIVIVGATCGRPPLLRNKFYKRANTVYSVVTWYTTVQ